MKFRYVPSVAILFSLATGADEGPTARIGDRAQPLPGRDYEVPRRMQNQFRNGWADIIYKISADGDVTDAVVVDSSYDWMVDSLLNAVDDWRFQPAVRDESPLDQCATRHLLTFDADERVENRFLRLDDRVVHRSGQPLQVHVRRLLRLLRDGDFERADSVFEFAESQSRLGTHAAVLDILRAYRAELTGDVDARLRYLRRATVGNGMFLDPETYQAAVYARLLLEIKTREYASALRSWREARQLDLGTDDLELVAPFMTRIEQLFAGPAAIEVSATLDGRFATDSCPASWQYQPERKSFSIRPEAGRLDWLEVRCNEGAFTDRVANDKSWHIPPEWTACRVVVFGEKDARFSLLEIPVPSY